MPGTHQQVPRPRGGLGEQFAEVHLPVTKVMWTAGLYGGDRPEALHSLEAFLLFDRYAMTLRLLGKVRRIARAALPIGKPRGRTPGAEGESRVQVRSRSPLACDPIGPIPRWPIAGL